MVEPFLEPTNTLVDVTCTATGRLNITLFALSSPAAATFILPRERLPVPALSKIVNVVLPVN